MMCYDEMTFINFLLQIRFIDTFSHIFICPETMSVALFLLSFFGQIIMAFKLCVFRTSM